MAPVDVEGDVHAQGSQRFGDIAEPVSTDNDCIHGAFLFGVGV
jgi:hypothetical protein